MTPPPPTTEAPTSPTTRSGVASASTEHARNALKQCEVKLATSNVDLYYALLFTPRTKRDALLPLYALWQEVREIDDECRDPAVAHTKFAWWHQEIHDLFAGEPHHPTTVALLPAIDAYHLTPQPLFDMIESVAAHIERNAYSTYAELLDYGKNSRGNVERMASQIGGTSDANISNIAAELGARLEVAALIRSTAFNARRHRCYFPAEDLRQFNIDVQDIYSRREQPSIDQLIVFEVQRVRAEIDERIKSLPIKNYGAVATLLVSTKIADAILARAQSHPTRLLSEPPSLHPVKKLWVAWRTGRKAQRHIDKP